MVSYALSTAVLRVDVAYDGQGRPVERTLYDEAGQVTEIARTTYDEAGREASEERYDPDGTLWSALTWEYDDQDRIVRQNDYRDGALAIYDVYEYDAQGRRVQASYYDGPTGALLDYEVYRYDETGNYLGSETYDADGSLRSTTVNE